MAESIEKTKETEGLNIWQVATVVLAVALLLALYWGMNRQGQVAPGAGTPGANVTSCGLQPGAISAQQAADKTVKYINDYLMQGTATATVKSVAEGSQFYEVNLSISGQNVGVYVTKDGKFFVPTNYVYNSDKPIEVPKTPEAQAIPKTDNPEVHLYTMSYCPYGNQADEAMAPVVKLLGSKVEVQPHYVIYSNYQGGGPKYCLDNESKYCSMHGIQELNQDVRELCVYKYQKDKFWDFVLKVNTACTSANVDSCWEAVAKTFGIDTEKVKTCEKDEAIALLKNEVALNAKYGVQGSPALVINGVDFTGSRTPEGYKQGVCSAFNSPPSECNQTLTGSASTTASGSC